MDAKWYMYLVRRTKINTQVYVPCLKRLDLDYVTNEIKILDRPKKKAKYTTGHI